MKKKNRKIASILLSLVLVCQSISPAQAIFTDTISGQATGKASILSVIVNDSVQQSLLEKMPYNTTERTDQHELTVLSLKNTMITQTEQIELIQPVRYVNLDELEIATDSDATEMEVEKNTENSELENDVDTEAESDMEIERIEDENKTYESEVENLETEVKENIEIVEDEMIIVESENTDNEEKILEEVVELATDSNANNDFSFGLFATEEAAIEYPVAIDSNSFPDETFMNLVAGTSYDKDADGFLSETEAKAITTLTLTAISDITGLEYFTSLKTLTIKSCTQDVVVFPELSALTKLTYTGSTTTYIDAYAVGNTTTIDFNGNSNLAELYIAGSVSTLYVHNCALTELDVSECSNLSVLYCYNAKAGVGNIFKTIDLSKNAALTNLQAYNVNLESIDLSANTALKTINIKSNLLSYLDLSKNIAVTSYTATSMLTMKYFILPNNGKSYSLSNFNNDSGFYLDPACVNGTEISGSVVGSGQTIYTGMIAAIAIDEVNFPDETLRNKIATGKYQYFAKSYYFDKNQDGYLITSEIKNIQTLSLSGVTDVKGLEYLYNLASLTITKGTIEHVILPELPALTTLVWTESDVLKTIEALECPVLDTVKIYSNPVLETYNLSDTITYLNISTCNLTNVDLEKYENLVSLYCIDNLLTELDTSNNPNLSILHCYNNKAGVGNILEELDLSQNPALTEIQCYNTSLKNIDLSGCVALTTINAKNTKLNIFDFSDCVSITSYTLTGIAPLKMIIFPSNDKSYKLSSFSNGYTFYTTETCEVGTEVSGNITATGQTIYTGMMTAIEINEINFPDPVLRDMMANGTWRSSAGVTYKYDENQDGYMTTKEFEDVTKIYLTGVGSLKGIEYCHKLVNLGITDGILDEVLLPELPTLVGFYYNSSDTLVSLDATACVNITTVQLTGNPNLETALLPDAVTSLDVSDCGLTELDVSGMANLTSLTCTDNELSNLDLSNNDLLTTINTRNNPLYSVTLPNNGTEMYLHWFDSNLWTDWYSTYNYVPETKIRKDHINNINTVVFNGQTIYRYKAITFPVAFSLENVGDMDALVDVTAVVNAVDPNGKQVEWNFYKVTEFANFYDYILYLDDEHMSNAIRENNKGTLLSTNFDSYQIYKNMELEAGAKTGTYYFDIVVLTTEAANVTIDIECHARQANNQVSDVGQDTEIGFYSDDNKNYFNAYFEKVKD